LQSASAPTTPTGVTSLFRLGFDRDELVEERLLALKRGEIHPEYALPTCVLCSVCQTGLDPLCVGDSEGNTDPTSARTVTPRRWRDGPTRVVAAS